MGLDPGFDEFCRDAVSVGGRVRKAKRPRVRQDGRVKRFADFAFQSAAGLSDEFVDQLPRR